MYVIINVTSHTIMLVLWRVLKKSKKIIKSKQSKTNSANKTG